MTSRRASDAGVDVASSKTGGDREGGGEVEGADVAAGADDASKRARRDRAQREASDGLADGALGGRLQSSETTHGRDGLSSALGQALLAVCAPAGRGGGGHARKADVAGREVDGRDRTEAKKAPSMSHEVVDGGADHAATR